MACAQEQAVSELWRSSAAARMLTWAAAITLALAIGGTRIGTIMPAARFFGQAGASIGVALLSALLAQQMTFSRRCAGTAR